MIPELVKALAGMDPPPTAEELAEALWLAARLPAQSPPDAVGEPAVRPADVTPPIRQAPRPPVIRPSVPAPVNAALHVATADSAPASRVRAPAVPALPRALRLARALRPLRITAPSPGRRWLDEEATAERFAETGVWEPVTSPARERRLDLALVVDTGSTMHLWQQAVDELRASLVQLAAFRDVRVWQLDADGAQLSLRTGATSGHSPDELVDPTRRRVVLVVSDCIGAAWQDGRFAALLGRWGRAGPVAIVQPLPQRMWWRCAAAFEQVDFHADAGGLPNDGLATRPRDGTVAVPPGLAVPVLELEHRWLSPWAVMVAQGGSVRGVALFTGRAISEEPPDAEPYWTPPMERVLGFRAVSSPEAFRLACHLAAAPLQLPVMRLVQTAVLPGSTPSHLAEVFLGGLLRRADPRSQADPEDVVYEFHDGVRDVLLGGMRRGEALRVLRAVWDVVRDRIGSTLDFPAVLASLDDHAGLPFAHVAGRVLAQLGGQYGEIARRLSLVQVEEPKPVAWFGVPPRNPNFTGRDDLLREVHASPGATVLLPDRSHGAGGEGKSQLAVEYAYRFAHERDLVWWIAAEQTTSVRSSLALLADRLGIPPSDDLKGTLDSVLQALRSGAPFSRWLIVYDNAGDPEELLPLMPIGAGAPGKVLVTSRDRRWEGIIGAVEVNVFDRQESITFLRRRAPRLSSAQADELAALVGDLPLAVEQVAAWQAVTGETVETYRRLFRQRLAEPALEDLPDDLSADLAVSLALTFELLRAESPVAALILELWAFFGPEPVSRELLRFGTDLPESMAQVVTDDDLLRNAMRDISRFALGRFDSERVSLQVHGLVRAMLTSTVDRARVRAQVHAILAAATAESADDVTTWPRLALITPHVLPAGLLDGDHPRVALDQALYLEKAGDLVSSRSLAELAYHRLRERFGADDELTLTAARTLANALRALGDIRAAADLNENSLNRMRARFGPDYLGTLFAANGFGSDLRFRGDFQQAYELDTDTWRRLRRLHGPDHPDTLRAANNVGIDLRLLGRFHEAYEVDLDALNRLGQRDRDVFRATHHLARDLHGLGRYAEALRLQQVSLDQIHAVLAPDHALVLQAKVSHVATLRAMGARTEAEKLAADTYEVHVRRFGEEHPDTLAAMRCLAIAGTDHRLGVELGERASAAYRRVLGSEHPFVHAAAAGLGIALRAAGDVHEALEKDEAAYRALTRGPLGPDHYYTLCATVGVANDLYLLGEWEAAADLSRRTMERFRARLGPHHPYTLSCAHNHRLISASTDDPVAELRRLLGDAHPSVRAAAEGELLECPIEPTSL